MHAPRAPDQLALELEPGQLVQEQLAVPAAEALGQCGSRSAMSSSLTLNESSEPAPAGAVFVEPVERHAEALGEQLVEPRDARAEAAAVVGDDRLDDGGSMDLALIVDSAAVTLVQVREPLVLISQVQRSGGTLLSQLFDGHPECHAHPGELHIGPGKSHWPDISTSASRRSLVRRLVRADHARVRREGYSKTTAGARRAGTFDVFPFRFDPELQRAIFLGEGRARLHRREVLDAYMTSYFNAWLDNANLRTGPKRVVTAFAAAAGDEQTPPGRLLRRLPGRHTRHDRARAPRLVRVQPPLQGALRRRRPRQSRRGAARRGRRSKRRERYGDRS